MKSFGTSLNSPLSGLPLSAAAFSPSPLSSTLLNLEYEFSEASDHCSDYAESNVCARELEDMRIMDNSSPISNTTKKPLSLSSIIRKKKPLSYHKKIQKTAVGLRELAKKIGEVWVSWEQNPKNVLLVAKISDESLLPTCLETCKWLIDQGMTVYLQRRIFDAADHIREELQESPNLVFWEPEDFLQYSSDIDFTITFGGDGTVLFAAWLFQQKVPPIIPFAFGSLGFLTCFESDSVRDTVRNVIQNEEGMRMSFRMRFSCTVLRKKTTAADHGKCYQVLNDLVVDRGPSPFLSNLELFGNGTHLTTVQADGLIISTPTGSTAYSLSAGGSVVHSDVSAILVTPICPHSLSFRPMILPDTMEVKILIPQDSRSTAWVSFDGRHRVHLKSGDSIQIKPSQFPVPTVCKTTQSEDWFDGLEKCLSWNKRGARQKAL